MTDAGLTLRERKKLRTRHALVDEALRLFTEKGFAAATLDELVEAVEVSQRTFFRMFASKEDVALAPEKELWAAYSARVEAHPPGPSPLPDYVAALRAAVEEMADGWEARFLTSRALCDRTPALVAHSLRHCADVTDRVVALGLAPGQSELERRLLIELFLTAWRWALARWAEDGAPDRAALRSRMDDAFAALPDLAPLLSAAPRHEEARRGVHA
ncbi:TetR/AcrR family transcriptional regulator [Streptomyces avicenniae]|uniref:TetR/AcrR family transcriptional regulator n=1 Tax=Streptomyces avicenniae TaxID=500153 RepID=UPI00069B78D4|nr:TetR/AcrR family transcriptional regulator [Streptomyces avicenniae]